MHRKATVLVLAAALSLSFGSVPRASAIVSPPDVNPADFAPGQPINNVFFPMLVGTKFIYNGTKSGIPTHDEMCVTRKTKLIEGVNVAVVHHRSFEAGVLIEDTFDYLAQDVFGNVWYFGEDTTEFPSGSTEGSWQAGGNEADAGFVTLANPHPGDRYYQECPRNVAVDQSAVLSSNETVSL